MIYHHWFDIYIYIYNFITINQHQPTRLLNTAQLPRNAADSRDATVAVAVVATVASVVPGDAGDQRSRALAAAWRFKGIGVDVSGFFPWKNGGFPWKNGGFPWWFHGKMVVFHGILMVVQWDILSGIMRYWWDTLWLWLTVSYWTWPIWFVDLPKDGDFPLLFVCLPEGNHDFNRLSGKTWHALEKWSYMVMLLSMAGFYIAFHLVKPWKTTWKLSPNWW